ncbi:myotrophin-like isoform X2 [Dermatophagoides pteronyssinus]|uniref:Myotrophin-like isoform X2 n=1 Tax=Dermatophagoides pteronyssinus TaxID=6956 RepID=A0A6P6XXS0_DERPT|nr:myotrophin-like isoform X2 [Dermatophagoides pteronyssinus]XP_027198122.1 myotrophin-like isoform X2 [Dermatophagoides pteronyssinus]
MATNDSQLAWSIKNGDLDTVKEIIEHIGTSNIDIMIDGRRPIHYAADYGQKEILEYLIQLGANVNSLDRHGISALLAAIWEGHIECCRLLISNGAKIDGRTPDGKSYVDAAENVEIKRLLMTTS